MAVLDLVAIDALRDCDTGFGVADEAADIFCQIDDASGAAFADNRFICTSVKDRLSAKHNCGFFINSPLSVSALDTDNFESRTHTST